MSELEDMRTFLRVVESGSFSAAARTLGATQPSVSRRIAALEADLGATLLVRSTRHVSLTDAGRRYLAAAQEALAAVEAARRAATGDAAEGLRGRLRVTAPVSFSTAWLAPRVGAFLAEHPDVELLFHFSEHHVDLVEAGLDLAIRIGGPDRADVMGRRLGRIRRHLVASPAWVARHGAPRGPDDLDGARALVFGEEVSWRGWSARWRGEERRVRPRRTVRATSGDFLRVLALAGEGVAVLPDWLVADPLAEGRLVVLLPELELDGLDLWLLWPVQRHPSPAATRFVAWFAAQAQRVWAG